MYVRLLSVIERLAAAVTELAEVDPESLSDDELTGLLVELRTVENRLDHAATRLTGAFDARRVWIADGARSAAGWLTWKTRMPRATAHRRVRLARELRHMPLTDGAWAAGDIDAAHASTLARARTDRTAEAFERDEEFLVDHARTMRFDDFCRVLAYWRQAADPDGAERDAKEIRDERRCQVSQTFGGMWLGEFVLEPVAGAILNQALEEIGDELFAADWAEARARLGREPALVDLWRTAAQRRADALVEMAVRARTAPVDGRRPEPLFSVVVGYETFAGRVCQLANGTAVTPGSLAPWLTRADIERVVFDGPSRVIDVGVRRRFFTGATRRAVEIRDAMRCYHPACDATDHLEADHIEPYAAGGPTVQYNGRMACGYHNRRRNRPPPEAA